MKKQFHIAYTSKGKENVRIEFARNEISALEQAREHFRLFGYGDETDLEIIFVC